MQRRLTAEEVRKAARRHFARQRDKWVEALVIGKLAALAKSVQEEVEKTLAGTHDVGSLAKGFYVDGADASASLSFQVGDGNPVRLLFGTIGDGEPVWGVFPDIPGDFQAPARRARTLSYAL